MKRILLAAALGAAFLPRPGGAEDVERVRIERRRSVSPAPSAPAPSAPAPAQSSPASGAMSPAPAPSSSGRTYIYRRRRVEVQNPSVPQQRMTGPGRTAFPERDARGARITLPQAGAPPAQHSAIVRNSGVLRDIRRQERLERAPRRYYWHERDGVRYSHYYDGRDHWYGFYHGPRFYWTRFYGDRWWWYDPAFSRWDYWWNGYWWWPGPAGVYVYMNNGYYPYEGSGVTVEQPEYQQAPAYAPSPDQGAATSSADGTRMVQVTGSEGQAFLYDKTASPPRFMKYLGQGVSRARFSGGTSGAPLQLLLEFRDDSFALYDADGDSLSSAVKATAPASAPPIPESVPPPPSKAPGE